MDPTTVNSSRSSPSPTHGRAGPKPKALSPKPGASPPFALDSARLLEAQQLIAKHLPETRLVPSRALARGQTAVYLKLECELPTGSCKVRGALYALSVNRERRGIEEVVAASTGNHGAAVAYAARLAGLRATIFLPDRPNPVKAARIADLGARIVEAGADLTHAIDAAADYASTTAAFFLHDAADPDIPYGTATIALEILKQLPSADALYVPVGDTALIRGVAYAAKQARPGITIVGVQSTSAPAYVRSWQAGAVVETATADTIADGLAVRRPLADNVSAIRTLVDDMRLVADSELLSAVRLLRTEEDLVVEPSGAAPAAALCQESDHDRARAVVLIVTGSNVSPDVFERASVVGRGF
jgi:threonine dehydratase